MATQDYTPKQIQRFWSKIDISGGMFACWIWVGACSQNGYGQLRITRTLKLAHRVSWEIHFGEIPTGLEVCHNCPDGDNPSCVNPAHLWLGTQKENMNDCSRKGRIAKSEKSGQAKLTQEIVNNIRSDAVAGYPQRWIARFYGIARSRVSDIVNYKTWRST